MGVTFFDPPVDVTPGSAGLSDVDYAGVPDGASGVLVQIINTDGSARSVNIRKNGSTDDRYEDILSNNHRFALIGVDGSGIFEVDIETTGVLIILHGYLDDAFVFFTDAIDVSLSVEDAWTDIDVSSETSTDTAIAVCVNIIQGANGEAWGIRKNGSADEFTTRSSVQGWGIIGCDGSEIFEGYRDSVNIGFFLTGYATREVTLYTDAIDRELSGLDAYEDLPALPAGAIGGIYQVAASGSVALMAMRKNGTSYDYYYAPARHVFFTIECDASRLVEAKSDFDIGTNDNYFEQGYFEAAAAAAANPKGPLGMPLHGPFGGPLSV